MFKNAVKDQIKLRPRDEYKTQRTDSSSVKSLLCKNLSFEGQSDELKLQNDERKAWERSKARVFQMFHMYFFKMAEISKWFNNSLKVIKMFESQFKI